MTIHYDVRQQSGKSYISMGQSMSKKEALRILDRAKRDLPQALLYMVKVTEEVDVPIYGEREP